MPHMSRPRTSSKSRPRTSSKSSSKSSSLSSRSSEKPVAKKPVYSIEHQKWLKSLEREPIILGDKQQIKYTLIGPGAKKNKKMIDHTKTVRGFPIAEDPFANPKKKGTRKWKKNNYNMVLCRQESASSGSSK